jgi:hypothetical protein
VIHVDPPAGLVQDAPVRLVLGLVVVTMDVQTWDIQYAGDELHIVVRKIAARQDEFAIAKPLAHAGVIDAGNDLIADA